MGGIMENVKHILLASNPDLEIYGWLSEEMTAKMDSKKTSGHQIGIKSRELYREMKQHVQNIDIKPYALYKS